MEKRNSTQLKHHGIIGMKWGVRRFQNKDGSLTAAGRRRAAKEEKEAITKERRKTVKDMSDDELRKKIDRLSLEKRYAELNSSLNPPKNQRGKEFVLRVLEKSGENLCTQVVNHLGAKALNKVLGEKSEVKDKDTGEITTVIKDVIFANNKKKDK